MIKIDTVEALEVLKAHGIRTARSKYADSAGDALAFAERRNASDPRFLPIVLRVDSGIAGARAEFGPALEDEHAVRTRYDAVAPAAKAVGGRVLAQDLPEEGLDVVVSMRRGENGAFAEAGVSDHRARKALPLGSDDALALADELRAFHHREPRERTHRMLAHLFERLSGLFDEEGLSRLDLVVRLHENGYTVAHVLMEALEPLHERKRLAPRAHDRWGDEFHPSGRQ